MTCILFLAGSRQNAKPEGFTLFGSEHVLWISLCLLFIIGGALLFRAGSKRLKRCLVFFSALSSFLWQIAQGFYRLFLRQYSVETLPLHICSLASYLVIVHYFFPKKWLGEILYFPMLFGPWFAILFPDWTTYPAWSFMSCAGFCVHASILLYIILQMETGAIRPSVHRLWAPLLFLTSYAAVLIPFDRRFRVNYGFLAIPSPGSPLVGIARVFGKGVGYYIGYALLVLLVMFCAYLPVAIVKRKKKIS